MIETAVVELIGDFEHDVAKAAVRDPVYDVADSGPHRVGILEHLVLNGHLCPSRPGAVADSRPQPLNRPALLFVELVEQPLFPQIERTAWVAVGRVALVAVVKAPAGGAAGLRCSQVGHEILGPGIPFSKAAPKRFLVVNGNDAAQRFQPGKVLPGFGFGLGRRPRITRTMGRDEIHAHHL
jgi:hypothetical protein